MQDKRRLFIVGASHLGRELESWLELVPENLRDWKLEGYLHSFAGTSPLEEYPSDLDIVGDWEGFEFGERDLVIIGIADVFWREKLYHYLKDKVELFTFIAPNVIVGKFAKIGKGSVVCPNCIISTNVNIGNGVFINSGSQLGHDVVIDDFSSIMANVDLAGHVKIGKKVFIGSNAVVIPKRKIVDLVRIGAGSVVIRNIKKKGVTVFGNPALQVY